MSARGFGSDSGAGYCCRRPSPTRANPDARFRIPIRRAVVQPPAVEPAPIVIPCPVYATGTFGLTLIARAAGTIFSGTVTASRAAPLPAARRSKRSPSPSTLRTRFAAPRPGEELTISQWIGLWSGGQRYRVGERVLLFFIPEQAGAYQLRRRTAGPFHHRCRGAASCSRHNIFQPFERIPSLVGSRAYVSAISPWRYGGPVRRSECNQKR